MTLTNQIRRTRASLLRVVVLLALAFLVFAVATVLVWKLSNLTV